MKPGSRDGRSDLFPVVALAAHALACPLAALGHPLGKEGRPALRAWLGHRPGPRRELAVRILVAGVESLAAPAPPFHELASAAGLGTGDAESDRLGRLALGITRAGDELPEASALLEHGLAALGARLARLLPDLVVGHAALRLPDVPVELLVELAHQVDPVGIAFLDLVERLLELGGE